MKKMFMLFLLIVISIEAKGIFDEYVTEIKASNDQMIIFESVPNIRVGSSGIVMKEINRNSSFIISRFVITKIKDHLATALLNPYTALNNDNFPTIKAKPEKGDMIVVNYLYNRVLPIVPNSKIFADMKLRYKDLRWIHPDILSGELVKSSDQSPAYENFDRTCQNVSANMLFFAIEGDGYFVDCKSFKILKKIPIKNYDEIVLPFYTRIKNLGTGFLNFGNNKKITDYNSYYNDLLKEKNQ